MSENYFHTTILQQTEKIVREHLRAYLMSRDLSHKDRYAVVGLQNDLFAVFDQHKAEETTEETKEKSMPTSEDVRFCLDRVIDSIEDLQSYHSFDNIRYQTYQTIIDHVKQLLPKVTEKTYRFVGTDYHVIVRFYEDQVESVSRFYESQEEAVEVMNKNNDWEYNEDLTKIFKFTPNLFSLVQWTVTVNN